MMKFAFFAKWQLYQLAASYFATYFLTLSPYLSYLELNALFFTRPGTSHPS